MSESNTKVGVYKVSIAGLACVVAGGRAPGLNFSCFVQVVGLNGFQIRFNGFQIRLNGFQILRLF